jgi:PPOX class probable F420-dependent enzyme
VSRFMALQYKINDGMRHRRAFEVAGRRGTAHDFESLRGSHQCLVVTFKRSGQPVPTPVNFGLSPDGRLYFRSEPQVAKIRRLRRDPHVRICRCNFRGKPLGPLVECSARVLPGSESERAYAIIDSNYRPEMRLVERGYDRMGVDVVYVEVVPD